MKSTNELMKLVMAADKWVQHNNGDFSAVLRQPGSKMEMHVVQPEELAQLHTLFSDALSGLLHWCHHRESTPYASGDLVRKTLSFLRKSPISFEVKDGTVVALAGILQIEPVVTNKKIQTFGTVYTIQSTVNAPFVVSSRMATAFVPEELLENRYPGWQQRFQMAKDLGSDIDECLRLALVIPVVPEGIPLPDVDLTNNNPSQ